jgi:hypothetical protein
MDCKQNSKKSLSSCPISCNKVENQRQVSEVESLSYYLKANTGFLAMGNRSRSNLSRGQHQRKRGFCEIRSIYTDSERDICFKIFKHQRFRFLFSEGSGNLKKFSRIHVASLYATFSDQTGRFSHNSRSVSGSTYTFCFSFNAELL